MTFLADAIEQRDWADIEQKLGMEGFAHLPGLINADASRYLAHQSLSLLASQSESLASKDLGQGHVAYLGQSLPTPWLSGRTAFYRHLAPMANRWNQALGVAYRYPGHFEEFQEQNRRDGQTQALSHVIRLGTGDYLSLHQRNLGARIFPMQVIVLLSDPGADFGGGELVMTEQRPRMQSRPMVLPLAIGDAAIISTSERPFKGTKGYYRANIKHAISRVRHGDRVGVELSFHDAP
ncbi:2OG-Fe(II) oxygenase [Dyella sp. EPa41]|uniref:2OG-Fe(II) oxygenase n=1 Tax=Dyella sp. EPa41 TaxID=1561194 RepID=UPI0019164508|nr:2OG-Fe(II) oxygenase [Dyella sp. EPa41]